MAAAGVPHTPAFPELASRPEGTDIRERYAAVAQVLDAARPDVLCVFTSDHINTFFLDNWPNLAVIAADEVSGPLDEVPGVARTRIPVHADLAAHLYETCVRRDFDPALVLDAAVDHSVVVPLHFLNANRPLPIVPIHVNGMIAPLPAARRCLGLGAAVADGVRTFSPRLRVAVVASGSFSLEVGGPAVHAGATYGVPRPDWAARVLSHLRYGRHAALAAETTPRLLAEAGTVAGELLSWLGMLGAAEGLKLAHLDYREGEGHGFVAWSE
ncbi:hypothetical protein AB0A77_00035 [Streptomyces varsoviensis]|uniref:DODA-type extradiol aromatic ring-opening family dioxygenase n=1 Tax=Streptomyces varsoviensis TaxID=67373 RepID=UPI0033C00353